jgi:S1/P1 nuclease
MHHAFRRVAALVLATSSLPPTVALAWNGYGHELSACVAYQDLKPETKKRVNVLLRSHPDYDRLLAKGCPSGFDKDQFVFMKAAIWPDLMRDKQLDPDLVEHHGPWHYINVPCGSDVASRPRPESEWKPGTEPQNIVQAMQKCAADLREPQTPDVDRAKRLCWIEHLIGDVHQPLHTVSNYSTGFENGDEGGNLFLVSEKGKVWKLHAFWDDVLGTTDNVREISKCGSELRGARDLSRGSVQADLAEKSYVKWVDAGVTLAGTVAYEKGQLEGARSVDKNHLPATAPELPTDYRKNAEKVARRQIALAGYRLADVLNELLAASR